MKKIISLVLVYSVFSFSIFSQNEINFVENQLIIKFKPNKKPNSKTAVSSKKFGDAALDNLNKSHQIKSVKLIGNKKLADTYILKFNSNQTISDLIKAYKNTGLFEYVEPNYIGKGHGMFQTTPNDALFNRQWCHHNDGTFSTSPSINDADMDTDLAWDITQGASDLVVAILDTGLKLDHPEVVDRIWVNTDETNGNFFDSDNNGYIDDHYAGWDFVNDDNDPTDDYGHGTNVAGIAIATGNNDIGYAGMNWNSKIMVCKVLDDNNTGYYSDWADAIRYAVDNGADVINLSAGGNSASSYLEDAINYAYNNNVPVVVSTGNQNSAVQYPAKYVNTFAVGSTDADDTRSVPFFWDTSSGSNFGSEIDFVAPGNYIFGLKYDSNTNYNTYWGGTSQAAPQVTGLVSLLLSVNPSLTVDQIRTILEETSEDQVGNPGEDTAGWDQYYGYGRVNAYKALTHGLLNNSRHDFENFAVYPNPVKDRVFIKSKSKIKRVILRNILGKKILDIEDDNGVNSLNVSSLQEGFYILSAVNEIEQSIAIKIVKE